MVAGVDMRTVPFVYQPLMPAEGGVRSDTNMVAGVDMRTVPFVYQPLMPTVGGVRWNSYLNGIQSVNDVMGFEEENRFHWLAEFCRNHLSQHFHSWYTPYRLKGIFCVLIELLEMLEKITDETGVPVPWELSQALQEKVDNLKSLWSKMPPYESTHLRIVLFALVSQLYRAKAWLQEHGHVIQRRTQIIINDLLVFLKTPRIDLENLLCHQKEINNRIWRFNSLNHDKLRLTDWSLKYSSEGLSHDLFRLASYLLSAVIEDWVVLRQTQRYYDECYREATTRRPNAYGFLCDCEETVKDNTQFRVGLKVIWMVLSEMQLQVKEWRDDIGSSEQNGGNACAGDVTTMAEEIDRENVDKMTNEALHITSCILSKEYSKVSHNNTSFYPMFHLEFLDKEKFKSFDIMPAINCLISLNNTLTHLKWSVERLYTVHQSGQRQEGVLDVARNLSRSREIFWESVMGSHIKVEEFEWRLGDAYGPESRCSWRSWPIYDLLLDSENEALRQLASQNLHILHNLDRVTFQDQCFERGALDLKTAMETLSETNMPSNKIKAPKHTVFFLFIFPVLYLGDIGTDLYTACDHLVRSNYWYFALTLLFILGPLVANVIRNCLSFLMVERALSEWKMILDLKILELLPRAFKNLRLAIYSRKGCDDQSTSFFSEVYLLRIYKVRDWAKRLQQNGQTTCPVSSDRLIPALCYATMIMNEKALIPMKTMESFYESAPQLLLQLCIFSEQLAGKDRIGPGRILGIVLSLASFSWTLHLNHYNKHYSGLENNFMMVDRVSHCIAHFLTVGCRLVAMSLVAAAVPKSLIFYLVCLVVYSACLQRIKYGEWVWISKEVLRWPFNRIFTSHHTMEVSACANFDYVMYFVETLVLTLIWPFLLDSGHPLRYLQWPVVSTILVVKFVVLPLLLVYNETICKSSKNCRNFLPFTSTCSRIWERISRITENCRKQRLIDHEVNNE